MSKRTDWHQENFEKLPKEISNKAIEFLKTLLSDEDKNLITESFKDDPDTWWAEQHFHWGMYIRNRLRDGVCTDEKLPSLNWDDYYVILVEKACGLK
jgi:hypothetical protein